MSATNTSPLVAPTRAKEQVRIKHLWHVLCINPQFLPIPRTCRSSGRTPFACPRPPRGLRTGTCWTCPHPRWPWGRSRCSLGRESRCPREGGRWAGTATSVSKLKPTILVKSFRHYNASRECQFSITDNPSDHRRDGRPTVDAHEAFFDGRGNMPLGGEEVNSGYKVTNLSFNLFFQTPNFEPHIIHILIRGTDSECSWSCFAD